MTPPKARASTKSAPVKPHFHGHRERLRKRVIDKGPESLSDYELVEFLLFGAKARGDTKPLAKSLMNKFKSLAGILAADPDRLMEIDGMGETSTAYLRVVREAAARMALEDARELPVVSSWSELLTYCRITLGHEKVEQFRLLFLDKKNRIIADELQQRGTVDHAPVYPREVLKRALELEATALILVHNHPSGDPTPSAADIAMTKEIKKVAKSLGISLHDHLIIARDGHASFKSLGLL